MTKTKDEMNICVGCDDEIVIDEDLIDFDGEGNIYHLECFAKKTARILSQIFP